MDAIIASVLTSIIVSMFTFVLGLKSGKNQADRAFLQTLYRRLYTHFSNLERGIKEKKPKRWEDFKSVSEGNSIWFYPDVRDMERSGELLYIKKHLARRASELEADCLIYPDDIDDLCVNVHEKLIKSPELFKGELIDATYEKNKKQLMKVETQNPTNCKTYRPASYLFLFDKERLIKLLDSCDGTKDKRAIDFRMRGNPPKREFIIYPDSLAEDNRSFAEVISKYVEMQSKCLEQEKDLLKRISRIKKKLAKRAKNPTSFWETFAGAFIDIFQ